MSTKSKSASEVRDCHVCVQERKKRHAETAEIDISIDEISWTEVIEQKIIIPYKKRHEATVVHINGTENVENFLEKIDDMVEDQNQIGPSFLCVDKISVAKGENNHLIIYVCEKCLSLKNRKVSIPSPETYFLFQHVHISTLCFPVNEKKHSNESKFERKRFTKRLQRFISALRNSDGGAILIHIADLAAEDKYLDYFNELVDDRLHDMIDDDELFTDVYKKSWLSDDYPGVVQLVVKPTSLLTTLNFCTKLSLDNKIVDPLSHTVFHFLKSKRSFSKAPPQLLGIDNIHESRNVQVKALVTDEKPGIITSQSAFATYVWNSLKLKEYITAFSKIDGGGSFYVGISEKEMKYDKEKHPYKYKSKVYNISGFTCDWVPSNNDFKEDIQGKLHNETMILRQDGQVKNTPRSIIDVTFHQVRNKDKTTYILEVAVAAVEGLLFLDTQGPESYELTEDNRIRRFPLGEWYGRLQEAWEKMREKENQGHGTGGTKEQ